MHTGRIAAPAVVFAARVQFAAERPEGAGAPIVEAPTEPDPILMRPVHISGERFTRRRLFVHQP